MLLWNGARPSCSGWQVHPDAPCRQHQCHPLCPSLPHSSSRHSPCDRIDGGGGCPGHSHPLVPRKQRQGRQPQRQGLRSQQLPRPSQGHHRRVRAQRWRTQGPRSSLRNASIPAGPRRDQEGHRWPRHSRRPLGPRDRLEAKEKQDAEDAKAIRANRRNLEDGDKAIADLEALYDEVTKYWSDIKFHRNIGHVQYAAAITVDVEGGTLYTSDWAAFLAAEAEVKDEFEGNVVDLGAFRLIFLIFTSSNETNLIQGLSTLFQNLRRCSVLWVVVRPRSSFP